MREPSILLRSERIVTPAGVLAGTLSIRRGRIEAITAAGVGEPGGDAAVDVGRDWVVPGFIDTHVHGGGGAQLHTTDPAELAAACHFHGVHGTTALLATTVSAPVQELTAVLATIARATKVAPARARASSAPTSKGRFSAPAVLGRWTRPPSSLPTARL